MKTLIVFAIIAILNSLTLFTCQDCTAVLYQVYEINPQPNSNKCEYKTRARTDCAIWRDQNRKNIIDTCGKYRMSESILKSVLDTKYP